MNLFSRLPLATGASCTHSLSDKYLLQTELRLQSRCFLYFYAISCIVLSLVQFFTIYVSFEARRVISTDESWTR